MRVAALLIITIAASASACERTAPPRPDGDVQATTAQVRADWPEHGPVNVRRERAFDFTGDGRDERIVVTASGERYDSLDITLTIAAPGGSPLWVDHWSSSWYFEFDVDRGGTDAERAAAVRRYVDDLLDDARIHRSGMPPGMIGGDPDEMMRESVRYHLAELDWRRAASLEPQDPTPQEGSRRMRPDAVAAERVDVVVDELERRPTYSYFTGGEASYVIGWSEREQSFVRLFACC